jgi:succinate-semialdehyde dehydrogenase/glutarate-semialdehyde dehydrogenase
MANTHADYPATRLFIDGQWRDSADGRTLPVVNPATGEVIGQVAHAHLSDMNEALAAAERGFAIWKNTPAAERCRIMRDAAQLFRVRVDTTIRYLSSEQGKPLAEARGEALMAADIIDWFAEEGRRVYGRVVPTRAANVSQMVLKEPVGPVAAFTPWNFPINQIVRKLSAALATGCSIIVKAPEETPASPAELIRAFADAGVPKGVVQLLYGNPAEISNHLIAHPVIRKVTFTGSTPVGKQLASLAGLHMKRVTMELGGHAPVIVTADANVAHAAKVAASAKYRNAGQVCISPTRFLVDQSVADEFIELFVAQTRTLKVGSGLDAASTMGPLANPRRLAAMQQITEDALAHGATVATGGKRIGDKGNFFEPTVLVDAPLDSQVFNQEPFGPMAAIRRVASLDEAIAEANRLPFGLASYAFTSSLRNAQQLTQQLQTGMLWINQPSPAWPEMPFGGVKDSGYGSEGGPEALEAYLNTKSVSTLNL